LRFDRRILGGTAAALILPALGWRWLFWVQRLATIAIAASADPRLAGIAGILVAILAPVELDCSCSGWEMIHHQRCCAPFRCRR
jgi:hypothetical protein